MRMKKFLSKLGISFGIASALAFGAAITTSADILDPIVCYPTPEGGMQTVYKIKGSDDYAVIELKPE